MLGLQGEFGRPVIFQVRTSENAHAQDKKDQTILKIQDIFLSKESINRLKLCGKSP